METLKLRWIKSRKFSSILLALAFMAAIVLVSRILENHNL